MCRHTTTHIICKNCPTILQAVTTTIQCEQSEDPGVGCAPTEKNTRMGRPVKAEEAKCRECAAVE